MIVNKIIFLLVTFYLCTICTARCQQLNIGDDAPGMKIKEWIKGVPIKNFEKGKVYVVEFWATWCKPCIAAMPHLSELAEEYRDNISVLALNIYEKPSATPVSIRRFVDSSLSKMNFTVGLADSLVIENWINKSGEKNNGIPNTFVINQEGKLAWIGHPRLLDSVLESIMFNNWDLQKFRAQRQRNFYLRNLDIEANRILNNWEENTWNGEPGFPDSILTYINQITENEPLLKYAPFIGFHYFKLLLKTNQDNAFYFGNDMLKTFTYEEPAYNSIIENIKWLGDKIKLDTSIYKLGANAYKAKISDSPYPELSTLEKYYANMADWYWKAREKKSAIIAQQKAIEVAIGKNNTLNEILELESRLKFYCTNVSN